MNREHMVSIVVANWNGADYLARCLSSLQISARQSGRPSELIVVDDASTDDSPAMTASQFPRARLIRNRRNLGFARTVNRGVSIARGGILILTNNDLAVKPEFVGNLCRWFDEDRGNSPLFGVSAKTVGWYDGKPNQLCMGGVWRGGRLTPAYSDPKRAAPCLFVQAGAAAYDMALYRKLGGLDAIYEPGYWEDYDLCWRAARRGYSMIYDPDAFAVHVGGGSMRRRYGDEGVETMKARNHLIFEAIHLRSPRLLAEWATRIPQSVARGRGGFTRGLLGALGRLPAILRRRAHGFGGRGDAELLRPFKNFKPSF